MDKNEIIKRLEKVIEEVDDNISLDTVMLAINLVITNKPRKSLACMEIEKQDNNENIMFDMAEMKIKFVKQKDMIALTYDECCHNCREERDIIVPMIIMDDDDLHCLFCDYATKTEMENAENDW